MPVTVTKDPVTRADVLAALTENDVKAMTFADFEQAVLDGLSRSELHLLLAYLKGYSPDGVARAVRLLVDPGQTAPEPEPSLIVNWCPAETDLDGATLYCDRANGHPGSHHAPGPDEGSEVAWSDEPVIP